MHTLALDNVSFEIRAGEIYGIAGVSGNGQRELAEVIAGMRLSMGGKMYYRGQDLPINRRVPKLKQASAMCRRTALAPALRRT